MSGDAKTGDESHRLPEKELPLLLTSFSRGAPAFKIGSRSSQVGVLVSGAVVVWFVCYDDDNRLIIE